MTASLAVSRQMLHSKVLSCPPLSPAPLLLPLGPPAVEFSGDAEAEGPLLAILSCQKLLVKILPRKILKGRESLIAHFYHPLSPDSIAIPPSSLRFEVQIMTEPPKQTWQMLQRMTLTGHYPENNDSEPFMNRAQNVPHKHTAQIHSILHPDGSPEELRPFLTCTYILPGKPIQVMNICSIKLNVHRLSSNFGLHLYWRVNLVRPESCNWYMSEYKCNCERSGS